MSGLFVYIIVMLDDLSMALNVVFWLSIIAAGVLGLALVFGDWEQDRRDQYAHWMKRLIYFSLILIIPITLVPNTKKAAIIYVTPKMVNAVSDAKIPEALMGLANAWIEELKPAAQDKEAAKTSHNKPQP
ncbi:MAG: hypothetical protein WC734_06050 [Patescibacteria group bacterium]|jgi:hypothetical protein